MSFCFLHWFLTRPKKKGGIELILSMISVIDTASALEKMKDTWDESKGEVKTYGLLVNTEKGLREFYNARKAVNKPKQKSGKKPRNNPNLKLEGLVQIFDEDIKKFRTIKFAQIIAFRDYNSKEWQYTKLI